MLIQLLQNNKTYFILFSYLPTVPLGGRWRGGTSMGGGGCFVSRGYALLVWTHSCSYRLVERTEDHANCVSNSQRSRWFFSALVHFMNQVWLEKRRQILRVSQTPKNKTNKQKKPHVNDFKKHYTKIILFRKQIWEEELWHITKYYFF